MRFTSWAILAVGFTGSLAAQLTAGEPVGVLGLGAVEVGPVGDALVEWFGAPLPAPTAVAGMVDIGSRLLVGGTSETSLLPESFIAAQTASVLADVRDSSVIVPPRWLHQVIVDQSQLDEPAAPKARATHKVRTAKAAKPAMGDDRAAPEPASAVLASLAGLAFLCFAIGERRKRALLAVSDH